MDDKGMKKSGEGGGGIQNKRGYLPLNEGYSPLTNRGYQAAGSQGSGTLPRPPTGGSGQSNRTQSSVPQGSASGGAVQVSGNAKQPSSK